MGPVELIQLLEAAGVQYLLERTVEVVPDVALVVEDEAFAVRGSVRTPGREAFDVRVTGDGGHR